VWPTRSQYRNQVTNGVHIQNTLSIDSLLSGIMCGSLFRTSRLRFDKTIRYIISLKWYGGKRPP